MRERKPILIYDSACAFCRLWVARWQARTGDRVEYVPLQRGRVMRRLGVSPSSAMRAVQLVTPEGKRYEGTDAVFRVLGRAPELRFASGLGRLPVIRWIAARMYELIAAHRGAASRADYLLFGSSIRPPDYRRVREWYMRGLGATFFTAFTSLAGQLEGLYGERGILPIREYLDMARVLPPRERFRFVPTLFWLDASDKTLVRTCRAGQLCSVLLTLGIAPRWTAAVVWMLYLSFVSTGRDFLTFQWDALLLENGLHAIVVAPPTRRAARATESPPWSATMLMRWLAFRLQFESGHCKLASGDRTWRTGTACCYHYATQPLPTPLAWYTHQLPRWFQRVSTFVAMALELGAPFLAFAPRRLRHTGFWLLSGLQALIAATGNYGFFNMLTLVDLLWFLDDDALPGARRAGRVPRRRTPAWRRLGATLAALPLAAVSTALLLARVWPGFRMPRTIERVYKAVTPTRSLNTYGLFSVMTTTRPEIVIEGSDDGTTWREYSFRFKPGDLNRRPRWAAPHQPRLDWQMWFAALGPPPAWFVRLLARLLEGSPDVLALLDGNPFPEHPPKLVRALLYDYRMTDRATRRRTGAYWSRTLLGTYVAPSTLARPASGSPS